MQPESDLEKDQCSFCGATRPLNAPRGLCPRCLLREGLEGTHANGAGSPSDRAPGSIAWEPPDNSLAEGCLAAQRENGPSQAGVDAERIPANLAGVQEQVREADLARVAADSRAEELTARLAMAEEQTWQAQSRSHAERRRLRLMVAFAALWSATMVALGGAWMVALRGAWAWNERQLQVIERQLKERAWRVDMALGEARARRDEAERAHDDRARWLAALDAAHAVERLVDDARDEPTRRQIISLVQAVGAAASAAAADQKLLDSIVDIRSAKADSRDGSASDAAYAAAFREVGCDVDAILPEAASAWIRSRPAAVAQVLTAALDDWASERRRSRPRVAADWKRLVDAARAADPDPTRDRVRVLWSEPQSAARRERLEALARDADPRAWQPASLNLLAGALEEAGARYAAVDLLQRAQAVHPGDVWLNYDLGRALEELHPGRSEAAIGFFTAARALRPETAHHLAHALETRGRDAEAQVIYEDLTRLRSTNGGHWTCLGRLLLRGGDFAGSRAALRKAVANLRAAIDVNAGEFHSHSLLGAALEAQRKVGAAVAEYRECIRLAPDSASAHGSLGALLLVQSKLSDAVAEFREAIRLDQNFAAPHHNLGLALRAQGKTAEAIAEFSEAIRLDGELVGDAPFELGATLRRIGRYGEAIDLYHGLSETVQDNPRLRPRVAADLAAAEREAVLFRRLPGVLRGDDKPKDAAEGLEFALLAYHARQFGHSARLYAESFRADPKLAEDIDAQHRYTAACSAAQAAIGKGVTEPGLDEPAKARWRQRALDWLWADLAHDTMLSQTGPVGEESVSLSLRRWKADPELAGIRDGHALDELPETERRDWRKFWAEVDALIGET
jgi:tetratricopeptide (TPR) repeat protein